MAIVKKSFVLNLPDGGQKTFVPGDKVEGELLKHWFVQAHLEDANVAEAAPAESEEAEGETATKGKKK